MNLLITGGCGFIGSNFVSSILKKRSIELIVIVDSLSYAGDYTRVESFFENHKHLKFEKVDIRDFASLKEVFLKYKITHVIHFAAETHVDNSISGPREFIESNIIGTFNLLEISKELKVKRFHHISTDEVYGHLEKNSEPFKETTPYSPRNPYAASKAASDHLARAYYHTFKLPVTLSNCSNNYGPNQHDEKFIPTIIKSLLQGKKIPLYGKGDNVRDWIYVEDHCQALWLILSKGKAGETYNVGSNNEKKNIEVIFDICKSLNLDPKKSIEFVKDRAGHDFRYAIDNKKIKKELKWEPKFSFEEGLSKTIFFYKNKFSKNI